MVAVRQAASVGLGLGSWAGLCPFRCLWAWPFGCDWALSVPSGFLFFYPWLDFPPLSPNLMYPY